VPDAQELVSAGEELGIKMESLNQASQALEVAQKWEQQVAAAQIYDLQEYDIYPHEERHSLAWVRISHHRPFSTPVPRTFLCRDARLPAVDCD
jgi:hypothetical protein